MKQAAGCLKPSLAVALVVFVAVAARYHMANVIPVRHFPAPVPTPSPNGFDLYVKADSIVVNPGKPIDPVYDTKPPTPGEAKSRYSLARRQAWLKQNAQAFALFDAARAAQSRFPTGRSAALIAVPYGRFRELARYKVAQANTFEMAGQWRRAADARLDILEMANDLQRGGNLMTAMVGLAMEAIGTNNFDTIVPHLSAQDCRELNVRMGGIDAARPRFSAAMNEEKITSDLQLLAAWLQVDNGKRSLVDPTRGTDFRSLFVSRTGLLADNDRTFDAFIALADKPFLAATPKLPPSSYTSPFLFSPDLLRLEIFNESRGRAQSQRAELLLALHGYRLENGSYPATLNQLVPTYLPTLPIDPFGFGGSWLYKRKGTSCLAWSIGPDGKNDGGRSVALRRGAKRIVLENDSHGDYVAMPDAFGAMNPASP